MMSPSMTLEVAATVLVSTFKVCFKNNDDVADQLMFNTVAAHLASTNDLFELFDQ